jgi:hypothetical protein
MEDTMALYDPQLVDSATRDALLDTLAPYISFDVLFNVLDRVTLGLIKTTYPLEITFLWFTGEHAPADIYERRHEYLDARSMQLWFWRRLYTDVEYGPPRQRWLDGHLHPGAQLVETILARLKVLPFEVAINTWFAVCVELLQWCNVNQFLEELQKQGVPIKTEQDIPKHRSYAVAETRSDPLRTVKLTRLSGDAA